MTDTVNLGLPCIEGGQAQKHVTHNDALRILDALVQLAVLDRDLTDPPGAPAEGERWIVKASASGVWSGHDNAIAAWQDGGWQFSPPQTGWVAFVVDEGTLVVWNGSAWGDFFSAVTSIQNLALLGIGTSADATNPLSAKLNNTLFAAMTAAEGGDGDLRYKLSKEAAANTLSFLFQDNFSGRAEIGLIGDDDFRFKVSPDGATWYEGIVVDRTTGAVTFPNTSIAGGGRELLTGNRIYYVRTDGSDSNDGLADTAGGAFLTIQKAIDTVLTIDLGGHAVTIQVGAGTYAAGVNLSTAFVGGNVTLVGDTTTPSNVVISPSSGNCIAVTNKASLTIGGFKLVASAGYGIYAASNAVVSIANKMDFGACANNHMGAFAAIINVNTDYAISGEAAVHAYAADQGTINDYYRTVTLTGTPNFSTAFAQVERLADVLMFGNTFSGSATGTRYSVSYNAVLFTGGATLPGDVAGGTAAGGQYS